MFYNFFCNNHILDILQCISKLLMNWSFKSFLNNIITAKSTRKLHYVNLSIWEELVRLHAKEHQPHILRLNVFR